MKGNIKTPRCEACSRKVFNYLVLDFGSIINGKLSKSEEKRLCEYCRKATINSVESIGYFIDMPSRKIYPLDSLKYTGMVENLIKEELSKESKDFIRSFHKNKILKLFISEHSLEPFVNWIESIERKLQKLTKGGR